VRFVKLFEDQVAATLNVKTVQAIFCLGVSLLDILKRLNDLTFLEGTPGQVLVHLVVVLIVGKGNLVRVLCLLEVALKLIQNTDFKLSVDTTLHREIASQNGVLEVPD